MYFLRCFFLCKAVPFNSITWLNSDIGAIIAEVVNTCILVKNSSGESPYVWDMFDLLIALNDSCFIS